MDGVSAPAMATVVAAIGICTLLTGAFLIALGQLRLATLTNYIPLPVISGNLAFIGAFCFASSVKLMSNGIDMLSLRYPSDLSIWHALLLVGPGLLASVFMIVAQRVTDNAAVLPAIIILIPIIFYACLYGFNMSREDARAFGFLAADESITIKDSFELLNPQLVHWSALPSQVPNVLGLWLIVALGSTLDISACELALGTQKVNLNHEIEVIGWSNLLSGVCLGGTTSILFGQSTLAIKAGIEERSFGITVCVLEFIVCLLPGNITAYIPVRPTYDEFYEMHPFLFIWHHHFLFRAETALWRRALIHRS
jgi:SulP family sulfate permease